MPDNAIYHLVRAVDRVSHYEFPVQLDDANRGYFTGMSAIVGGEAGRAMLAVVKNPQDKDAVAILDRETNWHAMLRTTCVATMIDGGLAEGREGSTPLAPTDPDVDGLADAPSQPDPARASCEARATGRMTPRSELDHLEIVGHFQAVS